MAIFANHRAIFVHIPKTGGRSITQALGGEYFDYTLNPYNPDIKLHQHSTADYLQYAAGADWFSSFRFTFVRHPLDRLVSFYNYGVKRLRPDPFGSFSAFIAYVLGEIEIEMPAIHDGWMYARHRQTDYLNGHIDFIGKFERMEDDFKVVCDRLKINADLPKINSSVRPGRVLDQYTQEQIVKLRKYYKHECSALRYSF